jgi:hypothetical protein
VATWAHYSPVIFNLVKIWASHALWCYQQLLKRYEFIFQQWLKNVCKFVSTWTNLSWELHWGALTFTTLCAPSQQGGQRYKHSCTCCWVLKSPEHPQVTVQLHNYPMVASLYNWHTKFCCLKLLEELGTESRTLWYIPVIPATLRSRGRRIMSAWEKLVGPYLNNKIQTKGLWHGLNGRALA